MVSIVQYEACSTVLASGERDTFFRTDEKDDRLVDWGEWETPFGDQKCWGNAMPSRKYSPVAIGMPLQEGQTTERHGASPASSAAPRVAPQV